MYRIEIAISVSTSGGNQRLPGARPEADGDERDRMRDREGRHDQHQRAEPAERDDQAEQKQQMIRAVEDVQESELHEAPRGLVPSRVEPHEAGIARELEHAFGAGRRLVAQRP